MRVGENDQALAERLLQNDIVCRAVSSMYVDEADRPGLLLGFAAWNEEEIDAGVNRLSVVLREWR